MTVSLSCIWKRLKLSGIWDFVFTVDCTFELNNVNSLPFVGSFIIGMLNKEEIDENCRIVNSESEVPNGVEK